MATSIGVVPRAASATSETRARFSANLPIVMRRSARETPARVRVGGASGSASTLAASTRFGFVRRSDRRRSDHRRTPAGVSPSAARDDGPQSFEAFERDVRRSREFARPTGQYGSLDDLDDDPDDDPEDLEDLDLEALDAPDVRGGGVLLRVVAFALAAWCHALAPFGGRWGQAAASAKTATAVALFATPLQWFGVAFFLSAIASGVFARALRAARAFQPIRAEGPAAHAASARKTKTPTAGGVALVPAGCLAALVFTRAADPATNAVVACTLLFLAIGFKDDLGKLRARRNDAGLRPGAKLAAQCAVAGAFVGVVAALSHAGVSPVSTTVTFGFGVFGALWEQLLTGHVTGLSGIKSLALRMSDGFYYALAAFAVVSESNAVNVADGVDGLAASLCATAFVALGVVCLAGGRAELGCFSIAMGGASAGFRVVNRHPASAFMGDSGSLALGGALGAVAAAAGGWALFPLVCVTGVFVAEVLSVIAQVAWFKWTKRRTGEGARLFRMAPLHHHLELGGWGEVKVVATLVAFGAMCALIGVAVAGG